MQELIPNHSTLLMNLKFNAGMKVLMNLDDGCNDESHRFQKTMFTIFRNDYQSFIRLNMIISLSVKL